MRKIVLLTSGLLLLAACERSKPAADTSAPPLAATSPTAPIPPTDPPAEVSSTPSAAQLYGPLSYRADTLVWVGGRRLRLQLRARLDTTARLSFVSGRDTTKGFQGYFSFTVRDSLNQVIGQRTLTKKAFYQAIGAELAVLSYASLPRLLGYSAPLKAWVLSIQFGQPETDWLGDAVLLLDAQGRVRRINAGSFVGGAGLETTLSPDGRTLLTGGEIIRANQSALPLEKAGAELRGAFVFSDSLAVTLYEWGRVRPDGRGENRSASFQSTPAEKQRPNAFVINTHTGQTVSRFHYDGFWEELGYIVPWTYVPATRTAYLLDEQQGLYLVAARQPAAPQFLPFRKLGRYQAPARPTETKFELASLNKQFEFYADTLDPTRFRYRWVKE